MIIVCAPENPSYEAGQSEVGASTGPEKYSGVFYFALKAKYSQEATWHLDSLKKHGPSPTLRTKINGMIYPVKFDENLLETLFKIYFIEGWQTFVRLDEEFARPTHSFASVFQWMDCQRYYSLSKRFIALIVRQSLINIEVKTRESVIKSLTEYKKKAEDALLFYRFKPLPGGYSMDPAVARELIPLMEKALTNCELLKGVKPYNESQKKIEAIFKGFLLMAGVGFPFVKQPYLPDFHSFTEEEIRQMEVELRDALAAIHEKHFFALLAFSGLPNKFTELQLGEILHDNLVKLNDSLKSHLETLSEVPVGDLQSNASYTQTVLPWPGEEKLDISDFEMPREGPERKVVSAFYDKKDICMMSIDALDILASGKTFPRPGVDRCVLFNFKETVIAHLAEKKKLKERNDELFTSLNKLSAALSVTTLVPIVNEVTVPFAFILDLCVLLHTISKVNEDFSSVTVDVGKKVAKSGLDKPTLDDMLAIGGLIDGLGQYKRDIFLMLGTEFLLIYLSRTPLGDRLLAEEALRLRAHYYDIKTLYE